MNRVLKFWIVVGSILAVLGVGIAFGDSYAIGPCQLEQGWGWGSITGICPRLDVLVQEQNQTNNLLAADVCTHIYGSPDFTNSVFNKNATNLLGEKQTGQYEYYHDCIKSVLSDTK